MFTTLMTLTMILGGPPSSPSTEAPISPVDAPLIESSVSDVGFALEQERGSNAAPGFIVVLNPIDADPAPGKAPYEQSSPDGAEILMTGIPHGDYEVTIFASQGQMSFPYQHDGLQEGPIRAFVPPRDRVGKRVQQQSSRLIWGGVSLTSLSAVLAVGGLLAYYVNPCGEDGSSGGECRTDVRTQWGTGLVVAGGAGVVAGVTMMAVGHHRKIKMMPGVEMNRRSASLSLVGRF